MSVIFIVLAIVNQSVLVFYWLRYLNNIIIVSEHPYSTKMITRDHKSSGFKSGTCSSDRRRIWIYILLQTLIITESMAAEGSTGRMEERGKHFFHSYFLSFLCFSFWKLKPLFHVISFYCNYFFSAKHIIFSYETLKHQNKFLGRLPFETCFSYVQLVCVASSLLICYSICTYSDIHSQITHAIKSLSLYLNAKRLVKRLIKCLNVYHS